MRHADRFAHGHEQLERDAGPLADLAERLGGQGGESLVGRSVEEGEGERAALDRCRHTVERNASILERLDHRHAAHVAR
ncbi:MAG: hypothetical protein ACLP8B_03135 [Xanthobacteraceae bacterium]